MLVRQRSYDVVKKVCRSLFLSRNIHFAPVFPQNFSTILYIIFAFFFCFPRHGFSMFHVLTFVWISLPPACLKVKSIERWIKIKSPFYCRENEYGVQLIHIWSRYSNNICKSIGLKCQRTCSKMAFFSASSWLLRNFRKKFVYFWWKSNHLCHCSLQKLMRSNIKFCQFFRTICDVVVALTWYGDGELLERITSNNVTHASS